MVLAPATGNVFKDGLENGALRHQYLVTTMDSLLRRISDLRRPTLGQPVRRTCRNPESKGKGWLQCNRVGASHRSRRPRRDTMLVEPSGTGASMRSTGLVHSEIIDNGLQLNPMMAGIVSIEDQSSQVNLKGFFPTFNVHSFSESVPGRDLEPEHPPHMYNRDG